MRLPRSVRLALVASLAASCMLTGTEAGRVQSSAAQADKTRADAVKASFQSSFNDYLTYARGADELLPLSKGRVGGFGNWGATFVDALTTAHVMGLDDLVQEGINFTNSVDFDHTSQETISLFETTIRYLASTLSLYELTGKKDAGLIRQAKTIGDHLLAGWVGDNDIPFNSLLKWDSFGAPDQSGNAIIAEAGTLIIEFDRLSKYTGNATYRDHVERSMKAVINSKAVFPGLYGQGINPRTNSPTNSYLTWGGGSDSFFEYLLKYGQLIGSTDTYIPTWVQTIKSSVAQLVTKAGDTQADVTYLSDYNAEVIPQFSHLGCFAGGNWILGGKLLSSDAIVKYGLQLAAGCINTYTSSATGIGPESFAFKTSSGGTNGVTISDEAFYNTNGFNYQSVDYILRPEVLESVFYAYRATGDKHWQDLAWNAFNNIVKYCKAPAALAGIVAVNDTNTAQYDDSESFLYAELYKYLFLIFDEPDNISLDKYVFNTEGHPFELDDASADYSSINIGSLPSPSPQRKKGTPSPTKSAPLPHFSGLAKAKAALESLFSRHPRHNHERRMQRLVRGQA